MSGVYLNQFRSCVTSIASSVSFNSFAEGAEVELFASVSNRLCVAPPGTGLKTSCSEIDSSEFGH